MEEADQRVLTAWKAMEYLKPSYWYNENPEGRPKDRDIMEPLEKYRHTTPAATPSTHAPAGPTNPAHGGTVARPAMEPVAMPSMPALPASRTPCAVHTSPPVPASPCRARPPHPASPPAPSSPSTLVNTPELGGKGVRVRTLLIC